VANPTQQLSAPEQDTLVKQIGLALLRAAPRDWQRISANYRTVGRYHELDGEITLADGSVTEWVATHDIATLFGRLRAGMYREERGTWFNARYSLDAPASYNLEYDREEPEWHLLPPNQAYSDELRMFPRTDENVPDWLMRRLAGLGPERPGPQFRIARVFDGIGTTGRPVIKRDELEPDEQERLLEYLGAAPVVLPGRGFDIDRMAETPEPAVPVGFHSDGTWIWPAAVHFYLQEYGVTPDQELVDHIRANDYQVPEVDEEQKAAANEYLTRGPAAPEQPAALGAPPMPRGAHPADPGRHTTVPEMPGIGSPIGGQDVNAVEATQAWQPPADYDDVEDDGPAEREPADAEADGGPRGVADGPGSGFAGAGSGEPAGTGSGAGGLAGAGFAGAGLGGAGLAGAGLAGAGLAGAAAGSRGSAGGAGEAGADPADDVAAAAPRAAVPDDEEPAAAAHREAQAGVSTQYFNPVTDDHPDADELDSGSDPDGPSHPGEPVSSGPSHAGVNPSGEHPGGPASGEPALERLHGKLAELAVPPTEYRIGGPTKLGWSLEEVPEGWRVGWYEDSLTDSSVFGDADDAAAFMLGKVLLEPNGRTARAPEQGAEHGRHDVDEALAPLPPMPDTPGPGRHEAEPPAEAAHAAPSPVTKPAVPPVELEPPAGAGEPPMRPGAVQPPAVTEPHHVPPPAPAAAPQPPAAARPPSSGVPSSPGNWPIQPMPGEPPLTLFRGKKLVDLPPGSELDRFGGPDGNLTYVADTPYEERSLVPEWVNRPYHLYRVQRPIEVLSGVAIPWFNQPGGGSAFILPASVEELLAEGVLIELDPGEPPID